MRDNLASRITNKTYQRMTSPLVQKQQRWTPSDEGDTDIMNMAAK